MASRKSLFIPRVTQTTKKRTPQPKNKHPRRPLCKRSPALPNHRSTKTQPSMLRTMKTKILLLFALIGGLCASRAQTNQAPVDDWKAAPSNQPGQQYPQVNSEGRVRARIKASQAQSVQLDISGKKFPLTKGDDGFWVGDSTPQD